MHIVYTVTAEDDGRRAGDVLRSRTGMSRLMSKKIRIHGSLIRNGVHCRMIDPVYIGDIIEAQYWPSGKNSGQVRHDSMLPIIFQDEWLVIVNKPIGMVTHPTHLHDKGSVTDRLADHPLHPVFRLDRDTTGLLLIALNGHAHHVISSNKMEKTYLALVHGKMPDTEGIIDLPIGRDSESIMLRRIDEQGLSAQTLWKVCRYFKASDVSLVKFKLLTGRTHQIRLHSKSVGNPLLGDWLYGRYPVIKKGEVSEVYMPKTEEISSFNLDKLFNRQALHAASLSFIHPQTLREQSVTAQLPSDFILALQKIYKFEKESGNNI